MLTVRDAAQNYCRTYEFAYEIPNSARPFLIGPFKKVLESYPEQKYGILAGETLCKTCTEIMILFYGSLLIKATQPTYKVYSTQSECKLPTRPSRISQNSFGNLLHPSGGCI